MMMNEKLLLLIASVGSVITGSEAKGHTNECIGSLALLQPCNPNPFSDLAGCCDGLRAFTVAGCFCNPGTSLLLGEDGASLGDLLGPVCRQLQPLDWAEVPTSQVCSDFDAYEYGCGAMMSDNTLEGARLGSLLSFEVLFEEMNVDVCFDTPAFVAGLGAIMDEDPELYAAYGVGTYKGVQDMAEYFGMSFYGLNHGMWNLYPSTPAEQAQSYVLFSGDNTLLSSTVNSGFFAKGTLPYSDIRTETLFQFRPCSTKPWRFEVPPSAGFAEWNNMYSWLPATFKVYGPEFICKYHESFCLGELRQYDSEQECVDFMRSLPTYSEQCGPNTPLSGNTLGCRFKHHLMIPANPGQHCYHIGRNSADSNGDFKCNDELECSDPAVLAANALFPLDVDNPPQEVLDAAAVLNKDEIVQAEPFGCAIPLVDNTLSSSSTSIVGPSSSYSLTVLAGPSNENENEKYSLLLSSGAMMMMAASIAIAVVVTLRKQKQQQQQHRHHEYHEIITVE